MTCNYFSSITTDYLVKATANTRSLFIFLFQLHFDSCNKKLGVGQNALRWITTFILSRFHIKSLLHYFSTTNIICSFLYFDSICWKSYFTTLFLLNIYSFLVITFNANNRCAKLLCWLSIILMLNLCCDILFTVGYNVNCDIGKRKWAQPTKFAYT